MRSAEQVAALRALVDDYETLLSGSREMIVLWTDGPAGPRVLGQTSAFLPAGRRADAVLDFASWLTDTDATKLIDALEGLHAGSRPFEIGLSARDGQSVRAIGSLLGTGTVLRLRPQGAARVVMPERVEIGTQPNATARTVLASLMKPAFLRDTAGRIVFANSAYHDLARAIGRRSSDEQPAELLDGQQRTRLATGAAGQR
jgi:PAS domain-containing protein